MLKAPLVDPGGTIDQAYKYRFNGQEWHNEFALNMYDMDMRDYDPAIARWVNIDPVTHHSQSPFAAFDCNPVSIADPSGADGVAYGMAGQSWSSNPYPRGHHTFLDGNPRSLDVSGQRGNYDGEGGGDNDSNPCPSCKTKADWEAYYLQGTTLEEFLGDKIVTRGMNDNGQTLFFVNGEQMDLTRVNNRVEAFAELISSAAMINGVGMLGKYLSNLFKADDAIKIAPKLLNQINSAESLINSAKGITKVKSGTQTQGFIKGDGAAIFKAISRGGTKQTNGTILMNDGTILYNHMSTKVKGLYTIDINIAGQIYKIRVTP